MAIDYEKMTTIDCPKVGENIFCELIHLDVKNYNVKLKKNKVFFPDKKHRKFSMIESNEFLKASLKKMNMNLLLKFFRFHKKKLNSK